MKIILLAALVSQRSWVRIQYKPEEFFRLYFRNWFSHIQYYFNWDDLLFISIFILPF